MKTLTIEKRNKRVSHCKTTIDRIITRNGDNKQAALTELTEILGNFNLKLGTGGSHIWCSNLKNERVFIITGY